ncbi:division/cell wall cluster transcriptional repressor MraZ [Xylocopilactobacillus apicola]|uniref:Transcriptional regulator MraZ n=1 Tax=Xylocopilactobacillus apicola TaxID=2932184 RepID=A0AAU9D3C6_9LACO|nr:division/cell wall cluster transcriptional repressor MraZ [Xylocopilactobacillus apicola]BDR58299.1 transcriptional regulator MraZ [Xylocopilactobacillus apicola]
MFMGEFRHSLDQKGRIIIPANFRNELGKIFIVTRGMDGCLFIYPQKSWDLLVDKLATLSLTKKDARSFSRFFYSGASECEIDKQGRVNLPQNLITFANLDKDCVILGVNSRVEIWDAKTYEKVDEEMTIQISDISEKLMDIDFD